MKIEQLRIPEEAEAVMSAKSKSFVVVLTDKIDQAIELINCLLEEERARSEKQVEIASLQQVYENRIAI
jgi:pantothenate kinase